MAVIREDVVSIGFEVENNPFSEITAGLNEIKVKLGILDASEAGLKRVDKAADLAATQVDGLANSINASPTNDLAKPVEDVGKEASSANKKVTGLTTDMEEIGKLPLSDGVEKLGEGIQTPKAGFKELAGQAKTFAGEKLSVGVKKLGEGIKNPKAGFKELLGQAKTFAKEKLDAGIRRLPPQLQLGLKIGGKLAGVLGKAAKITFKTAVSGVKALATYAASAAKSLGKATVKGLTVGIAAAGTALVAGAVAAFKFGSAYETSLAKVSTLADTSVVSMEELSSGVMNLSNQTGDDAAGLNEAVYQALSAGADTAGVVDLVGTAVKAAKGGYTDTTTAIDGLTSTLNAYGMATSDAEGLANQFLITQNKGKTTFGELSSTIGTVAPTANAAGVGVDQLLASVASLTANGIGTSEAMTGMKAALSNVIKPSSEATKMAKSLGLEFNTAALQSKGLVGFLDDVKKATGGDTDKMAKLFGSVEALNTVLTLTSDQGSQLMNDTLNEMTTNTTALDEAYKTMTETAENSVTKGLNSFKNLGIEIYRSNEGPVAELTGLFANSGAELYEAFEQGGMSGLSGQIGSTLTKVLVTLTGYLPELIQSGSSIIRSLISGIMQNREQITSSVMQGLTNMAMAILQMAPEVLALGGTLLMSLVQGLNQQLPTLIPVAMTAIQNLCNGLIQNGPAIIQSGIGIIMQLVNGLIAAAPTILTTGIQLIIMLAQGLIGAIPQLVQAIPQIASAIITTLMSVNWLKLGWDIIKGIGSGIIEGIKGLFNAGKDAGKEVGDGVVEGLNESASQLNTAADNSTANAAESFKPDTVQLSDYGMQMPEAVAAGINSNAGLVEASAANLGSSVKESMNLAMMDMQLGTQPALTGLTDSFGQTLSDMDAIAFTEMGQMDATVQTGFQGMVTDAAGFSSEFKGKIDQLDLYRSGVHIMQGLNNGLNSMRGSIRKTALDIAADVKNSVNSALDIHSPSRVMEESGEYTGLGLVKGLENLTGRITKTALGIAGKVAVNMSPTQSRYSPESSAIMQNHSNSQVNTYSPVFNLTLNGASASDSNARKVKRWVKEALDEAVQGMGRTNLKTREV